MPLDKHEKNVRHGQIERQDESMESNRQTLEMLLETGQIDLGHGSIFDLPPSPMPETLDWGRVEGMMLGLAVGDALGCTSEGLMPRQRRMQYGEIQDYLPHRYADDRPTIRAPDSSPSRKLRASWKVDLWEIANNQRRCSCQLPTGRSRSNGQEAQ